jgi:phospholipase C
LSHSNGCTKSHIGSDGLPQLDYIPHHEAFQYYASTSNPQHLLPTSIHMIGFQDQANHQYDLKDFWDAVEHHNIPAVSFLKPRGFQDCHPKHSDPLAFQTFLVKTINRLQKQPEWEQMAIFIAFDDSGGWYNHVMPPIINQSHTVADALLGPGDAGNPPPGAFQARLAYGMRMPFLIISPFAKKNCVDHSITDQTSILRFIEDN